MLAAVLAAVLTLGCDQGSSDPEGDRQSVETFLRSYLPVLGQAYATGNLVALKEMAFPKEIVRVRQRVEELSDQGKVYEPELKELTIEEIGFWRTVNVVVTTVEVWDVRSYALGSHTLLGEVLDQRNRVKYQLMRQDDGRWMVMYRDLDKALD